MTGRIIDAPTPSAPVPLPRNRPSAVPIAENVVQVRRPGSKEVATLEVNGMLFTNWTSVRVEQRVTEAFPTFQFECTEEAPVPAQILGAQFVPGSVVRVFLGGVSAVFGYIIERHVAYEAMSHAVQLVGCGDTFDLTNSSVPLDRLGGHDNQSVTELARDISAHLGIQIHERGAVDQAPFDNIQVQPGETPMQVIERYAVMRNIVIGSEANGGLLLIGEHDATPSGDLVEGVHILRANCVIKDNSVYRKIFTVGQNKGSDDANGDPQLKQLSMVEGSSTRNRHMVVVANVADTQHGIERRTRMEEVFTEGSYIEANITVQGWFKDNNASESLWRAGEYYTINSPSLILNGAVLGCAGCVYEQTDQGGTITTMQLVKPEHMNGKLNYRAETVAYQRRKLEEDRAKAVAAQKAAADKAAQQQPQQPPQRRRQRV